MLRQMGTCSLLIEYMANIKKQGYVLIDIQVSMLDSCIAETFLHTTDRIQLDPEGK